MTHFDLECIVLVAFSGGISVPMNRFDLELKKMPFFFLLAGGVFVTVHRFDLECTRPSRTHAPRLETGSSCTS